MVSVAITIENNGTAVEGADVCVGEAAAKLLTTDSNGTVTKTVAADYAIAVMVLVYSGGVRRGTFGPLLLEADGEYTLDIGGTGN